MRLYEAQLPRPAQQIIDKYELEMSEHLPLMFAKLDQIKKDCQKWLSMTNNQPINKFAVHRGIKGFSAEPPLVATKEVRLNGRRPKDTARDLNAFINGYFKKHYGEAFRNSVFVTGSISQAGEYGTEYIVFPTGDFKFLWSPDFEDLFSITSEYGWDFLNQDWGNTDAKKKAQAEMKETIADDVLSTYTTEGIQPAILSRHEIMIRCPTYHAIKVYHTVFESPNSSKAFQEYLTL